MSSNTCGHDDFCDIVIPIPHIPQEDSRDVNVIMQPAVAAAEVEDFGKEK